MVERPASLHSTRTHMVGGARPRMMPVVVNVAEKLSLFDEHWSPRIAGQVNETHVKLVKLLGEFVWHKHDAEDELFFVLKGELTMRLRDGDRTIRPGEFIVIPRGTEHCPVAREEVHVMLVEPAGTLNTGDVEGDGRTVRDPATI